MSLYTNKDSEEFDSKLTNLINEQKIALGSENAEDALIFEEHKELPPPVNVQDFSDKAHLAPIPEGLPTHINQIHRKRIPRPKSFLFGSTKGKVNFSIDGTIFAPTAAVALAGAGFEKAYKNQLDNIIFSKEDDIDPEHLIHLVLLFKMIETDRYPILLTASRFNKLLPRIRKTLNDYILVNFDILNEICGMIENSGQFSTVNPSNVG